MYKRIAFGYQFCVGKDTACDYLISKIGGIKLSFAKPIKDILLYYKEGENALYYYLYSVYPSRVLFFEALKIIEEEGGIKEGKNRGILQRIGSLYRKYNDNIWSDYLLKDISCNKNIFISDLRFKNEACSLSEKGFKIIFLKVQEDIRLKRYYDIYKEYPSRGQIEHVSEIDLKDYKPHYYIDNNNTLENLYQGLNKLLHI